MTKQRFSNSELASELVDAVGYESDPQALIYDHTFSASDVSIGWLTALYQFKRDGKISAQVYEDLSQSAAEMVAELGAARLKRKGKPS